MASLDYIKSYLIRLGVDIDSNEISKWDSSLKKLDKGFKSTVSGLFKSYSKIGGIFSTLTVGIAKFTDSVAKSDMEMQRFARRMYMSRDSAKALQTTLDSMGLNGVSDLQDVALNPELLRQYKELISLSQSLNTPKAIKESLKDIRSIFFEFDKFQAIFSYFTERVTHFIYTTVGEPAKKFYKFLQDFNSSFSKNISSWAENLGRVLGNIVRLTLRLGEGLVWVVNSLNKIWNSLSSLSKGVIGSIFLINRIIKGSPIWKLVTVFTSFLMLLDDYKTYKEGGISAKVLKPVWSFVDQQRNDPNSGWNFLVESIKNLIKSINWLISKISEFIDAIRLSRLGQLFGLGPENQEGMLIGDNPSDRITNQLNYIKDVPFWQRLVSQIPLSTGGITQKEYIESRINNLDPNLINPSNNMVTNNSSTNNSSINQNFTFNVSGINNPDQFTQKVASLIRNNKSRLV